MVAKDFLRNNRWFCIAVFLIIAGSFFASLVNSSFNNVSVTRISFETEHGRLEGLLYMPRGAGAESPRPVIVTTHGYLNSAEMQDLTAIELSRRGFIVMAMHMYDHGESRWASGIPVGGQFATFWIHAQFNAVRWAFQQPWALRDAEGNGMIAVTGHSMGGFSSTIAMYFDELQSLQSGVRMIYTGLPVGADLSFAAMVAPFPQLLAGYGSRTVGFVAGMYDEFFFNDPAATAAAGGTVQRSDWTTAPAGRAFLGIEGESEGALGGHWHQAESGALVLGEETVRPSQIGSRIIFTPNEIHPWNHFSAATVGYIVYFFDSVMGAPNPIAAGNQIWQWKVFFNFITMIGFFLLVVPLASLLLKLPFLKQAVTVKNNPVPQGSLPRHKYIFCFSFLLAALIPAYLAPTLMERRVDALANVGLIAVVLGAIALISGIICLARGKDSQKYKTYGIGGIVVAAIFAIIWIISANSANIIPLSPFFVAPAVNTIAYWAIMSAAIALVITAILYFASKKHLGAGLANYGLAAKGSSILASLATAVLTLAILYILLAIMKAIFVVDGRIWTLAIRAVSWEGFLAALRYMPVFFIFYFMNTIAINANAQGRKAGILIAVLLNSGGLALWLFIQYATLFSTGVAWYPTMALNAILLFALTPFLGIAAVYAYKLFKKTNNVYLAAFTNTIFFTLMMLVNTAVFWNLVPAA